MFVMFVLCAVAVLAGLAILAAVDQTGTVVTDGTGSETLAAPFAPSTPQISYASAIDSLLGASDTALAIVVSPVARKVRATNDAAKIAAIVSAANALNDYAVILSPDSGQEGKSLTWSVTATGPSVTPAAGTAASDVVAAAKPRRTVASLVSALINAIMATEGAGGLTIVVDQSAGTVSVIQSAVEDAETTFETIASDSHIKGGDWQKLDFSEPATPGVPDPLIFEGGSTGA